MSAAVSDHCKLRGSATDTERFPDQAIKQLNGSTGLTDCCTSRANAAVHQNGDVHGNRLLVCPAGPDISRIDRGIGVSDGSGAVKSWPVLPQWIVGILCFSCCFSGRALRYSYKGNCLEVPFFYRKTLRCHNISGRCPVPIRL